MTSEPLLRLISFRLDVGLGNDVLELLAVIAALESSRGPAPTAGVMPEILEAWPRDSGRMRESFSTTSLESPERER